MKTEEWKLVWFSLHPCVTEFPDKNISDSLHPHPSIPAAIVAVGSVLTTVRQD